VLAALLRHMGVRHVRIAVLCLRGGAGANSTLSPQDLQLAEVTPEGDACQAVTEVRLGKSSKRLSKWVADHRRALKPKSKGRIRGAKELHYRADRKGYLWLSMRWVHRPEEVHPGLAYGDYDYAVTYYPAATPPRWEVDGEIMDSRGGLKLQRPTVGSILSRM